MARAAASCRRVWSPPRRTSLRCALLWRAAATRAKPSGETPRDATLRADSSVHSVTKLSSIRSHALPVLSEVYLTACRRKQFYICKLFLCMREVYLTACRKKQFEKSVRRSIIFASYFCVFFLLRPQRGAICVTPPLLSVLLVMCVPHVEIHKHRCLQCSNRTKKGVVFTLIKGGRSVRVVSHSAVCLRHRVCILFSPPTAWRWPFIYSGDKRGEYDVYVARLFHQMLYHFFRVYIRSNILICPSLCSCTRVRCALYF